MHTPAWAYQGKKKHRARKVERKGKGLERGSNR